ncbi:hypothetical protein Mapa_003442 [Marchantia paleacea]|nr:hypothetical protein Mapa_003442 [Marchantia paleacea]
MATFAAMLAVASCTRFSAPSLHCGVSSSAQKARTNPSARSARSNAVGWSGGSWPKLGLGLGFRQSGVGAGIGSDEGCAFGSAGRGIGLGMVAREAGGGWGRLRSSSVVAEAGKGGSVNAAERILAALGYILPFFDGIQYGRYFFMQFPIAEGLLRPLFPLLSAYKGFPYSNFIAFFSLYLLVVRNSSFSRYVRFNAMQAVVLDVLLILPTLVERTFGPRGGIGLQLLIIFYNTVFLFLVSCFLFDVFSCLLGKTPRLPIVADAADQQIEG